MFFVAQSVPEGKSRSTTSVRAVMPVGVEEQSYVPRSYILFLTNAVVLVFTR